MNWRATAPRPSAVTGSSLTDEVRSRKAVTNHGHLIAWAMKSLTTCTDVKCSWPGAACKTSRSVGNMRGRANATRAMTRNSMAHWGRYDCRAENGLLYCRRLSSTLYVLACALHQRLLFCGP